MLTKVFTIAEFDFLSVRQVDHVVVLGISCCEVCHALSIFIQLSGCSFSVWELLRHMVEDYLQAWFLHNGNTQTRTLC